MPGAHTLISPITDPDRLCAELAGLSRIVFDLDGTLYDTRDFERPALASVVEWLRDRSGRPLEGLLQALWQRRESDRHRPGLFDELLVKYGLPVEWGAHCAQRFHEYPGVELAHASSLGGQLQGLRVAGSRLALVSNGRPQLQKRKLTSLGLHDIFDVCIYCDPSRPSQLKPTAWAWSQLAAWQSGLPTGYVGDDPVDAEFAVAGGVEFFAFGFRSLVYED